MFLNFFNALVRRKERVLRLFQVIWLVLLISFTLAADSLITGSDSYLFWYQMAVISGKLALIFFAVTLFPGIFKRFAIRNRLLGLIMIFRRQFGITMFLLAAFHGLIVGLLPNWLKGPPFNVPLFQLFGSLSLFLLLFLFITSNDFSQVKLGKYWYLLHRLVYIIMWLILFHTAIQRLSFWSVLAAILVLSEMVGIIYSRVRQVSRP